MLKVCLCIRNMQKDDNRYDIWTSGCIREERLVANIVYIIACGDSINGAGFDN